jgi:GDP-mannose 6-dehydrogenase
MKVVVVGLGHVGTVTGACLLRQGHEVVGADTNNLKCDLLAHGFSPIREPGIDELIARGYASGWLSVTTNISEHADADVIIICVGTPGLENGALDLSQVTAAAVSIGEIIPLRAPMRSPMFVVFRSTMLPGSMTKTILPTISAAAGEAPGLRYEVVYNPAFTREGSAVSDYFAPSRIVIGERQPGAARPLFELYHVIDAPVFTTSFEIAELAKYTDNIFHALKVVFANEIGRVALRSDILPRELSDLFLADTQLNISSCYLVPGAPFGGPCLPKDVRAFSAHMNGIGIAAPLIDHILRSNASHADFLLAEIERRVAPRSRILLVGLSFKGGTDDLRESPLVDMAERLSDRGHDLAIYDPDLVDCMAVENGRTEAQFPLRLSAIILSQVPTGTVWDLVVIGKTCPSILEKMNSKSPFFHIDRL